MSHIHQVVYSFLIEALFLNNIFRGYPRTEARFYLKPSFNCGLAISLFFPNDAKHLRKRPYSDHHNMDNPALQILRAWVHCSYPAIIFTWFVMFAGLYITALSMFIKKKIIAFQMQWRADSYQLCRKLWRWRSCTQMEERRKWGTCQRAVQKCQRFPHMRSCLITLLPPPPSAYEIEKHWLSWRYFLVSPKSASCLVFKIYNYRKTCETPHIINIQQV